MKNYYFEFVKRGVFPLVERIENDHQKVPCIDKEGYKYYLSYHSNIADKRTVWFNKWDKRNPFKPYNMKLYASRVQENANILSSDEELKSATTKKVRFVCPKCGKEYEKKWCHWIGQPDNEHFCRKCSSTISGEKRKYGYEEVDELYSHYGYKLLEPKENFDTNGGHKRLFCKSKEGYLYNIDFNSLRSNNKGTNKFSKTNPYAVENLQKWCDDNNVELRILHQNIYEDKTTFSIVCECGNIYEVEPYEIFGLGRTRCQTCSKKESRLELATRKWLEANKIPFESQFRFEDCKYKRMLPFDFKCDWKEKVILIEVDGSQHYYTSQWISEEKLKSQKERDKIKTEYAKEKGYELLRIPFWHFANGTYEKYLNKTFFEKNK